jgi:DNA-nicking Smr family endonuclease
VNEKVSSSSRPRHRRLSAEEIELWLNVTKGVARRPGSRLPQPAEAQNDAKVQLRDTGTKPGVETEGSPSRAERKAIPHTPIPIPPASTPPPLAPLERRLRQKLARGRAAPEAVIDLHGMRRQEAFVALREFLARAQSEGARLVLVVTGKGERGALGEGAPGIFGFEEAQRPHGGAGAFYVRLRRHDRLARGKGAP